MKTYQFNNKNRSSFILNKWSTILGSENYKQQNPIINYSKYYFPERTGLPKDRSTYTPEYERDLLRRMQEMKQ